METLSDKVTDRKLLFLTRRIEGNRDLSNKEKYDIIPDRLFRYEKVTDERLRTLENNELYMSNTVFFNDPFDCKGVYWDIDDIHEYCKNKTPNYRSSKKETAEHFKKLIDYALKPLKIACFSENNYNLPLWGNYADNRRGFCVEYNFKNLGIDSQFTQQMFPVFYQEERLNCTFALKKTIDMVLENIYNPIIDVLFYKNLLKHKSWEYEQEWRLIFFEQENNKVKMPIKPTVIYAGDQCSEENLEKLRVISKKLSCELIQLKPSDYGISKFIFEENIG